MTFPLTIQRDQGMTVIWLIGIKGCPSCHGVLPGQRVEKTTYGRTLEATAGTDYKVCVCSQQAAEPTSYQEARQVSCPRCQRHQPPGHTFCAYCGAPMDPPEPEPTGQPDPALLGQNPYGHEPEDIGAILVEMMGGGRTPPRSR